MSQQLLADRLKELKPSAVRELLKHSKMPGVISLGGGIPNPALFDKEGLELATQQVMKAQFVDGFQYGLSEGYPPLREAIRQLCAARGIQSQTENILVTSGSQQSLDILARTLLNPGDVIVVERPTYLAALQVFQLSQATIRFVDTDENGMKVDELEDLVSSSPVKAVYLVPTFGNPGGASLSDERRKKLVALAKQHGFIVFEDDPYSEINFTDKTFKTLSEHAAEQGCSDQVIYTSTFSKILAPGLRVGWLVLPDWMLQKATIIKQATDLHSSALSQALTANYLSLNRLSSQIALIRESYRQKCECFCQALKEEMGEHLEFHVPQGGMFVWARFKYDFDTTAWLPHTLKKGVVYVPGEAFYSSNPDKRTLRMSYVTVSDADLKTAAKRLRAAL